MVIVSVALIISASSLVFLLYNTYKEIQKKDVFLIIQLSHSWLFLVQSLEMSTEEQPIQTLYINNLNDKLPKEQLKQSLYLLFSQFGTVLDVVALKTEKMRGQAWVSFLNEQNATDAKNRLQGFEFFGKPMVIGFFLL